MVGIASSRLIRQVGIWPIILSCLPATQIWVGMAVDGRFVEESSGVSELANDAKQLVVPIQFV